MTFPPDQGEPLNAIISGNSDEAVLKNQETDGGLLNYFLCVCRAFVLASCISLPYSRSFGFSTECLGQHSGDAQAADLGDGDGYSKLYIIANNSRSRQTVLPFTLFSENETAVIRWNYQDAQLGTCKETIQGGNHFRYWIQNGASGNRCAYYFHVRTECSFL